MKNDRAMWTCRRAVSILCFAVGIVLLSGCGSTGGGGIGKAVAPTPAGTSADLRGGWLIAGSMPFSAPVGSSTSGFGLALNLDMIDGKVTGYGSLQLPCGTGGALVGGVGGSLRLASAAVAADGTFTLSDVLVGSNMQHQVVVQGTVPATAGGLWSGTYMAAAPQASCNGVVPASQAGTFTAQKIPDLDGTFTGQGVLNNGSATASFTATITQGGSASLNGLTSALNDQSVLNGTLLVRGISCFKQGTMKTTPGFPEGSLNGNLAQMEFLMDDGSTVLLNGTESDTTGSTLTHVSLLVIGGGCDKTFLAETTATRQ